jgi:hypothetical protein
MEYRRSNLQFRRVINPRLVTCAAVGYRRHDCDGWRVANPPQAASRLPACPTGLFIKSFAGGTPINTKPGGLSYRPADTVWAVWAADTCAVSE